MPNVLVVNDREQLSLRVLIEEARRRQRRRRLVLLAVAILLIAGAATYVMNGGGGSSQNALSSPNGSGAPVITRTGLAHISFSYRDSISGGCIPDTNSPVTTGAGSIDLVEHRLAVTTSTQGCNDISRTQEQGGVRWIKGVLYTAGRTPNGSAHWTAVPHSDLGSYVAINPIQSLLTSPWALSVETLAAGSEQRPHSAVMNGQRVTEHTGLTNLLAVQSQLRTVLGLNSVTRVSSVARLKFVDGWRGAGSGRLSWSRRRGHSVHSNPR